MDWVWLVLAGIGLFLLGIFAGWGCKRMLCSGRLIVTEADEQRDIFLELDDEKAVLEHYVLLQVKRTRKNPRGKKREKQMKEEDVC